MGSLKLIMYNFELFSFRVALNWKTIYDEHIKCIFFFLDFFVFRKTTYHKIRKIMSLQYNLYKILYRKYFFVEKLTDLKPFFVEQNCFDNHSEIRIRKHRTTFCPKVLVYSFIRNAMLIPIILTLLFSRLYWLMM